ncbi:MAG: nuclear transport factor 2 family protein [Congregibacter sp.]
MWDIGPLFGSFLGRNKVRRALHEMLWHAWNYMQHIASSHVVGLSDADHVESIYDVDCTGYDVDCTGRLTDSSKATKATKATFLGSTYCDRLEQRDGERRIAVRDLEIHYFNSFPVTELSKPGAQ